MPGCPRCGQMWPDGYDRCPNDGMSLYPHAGGSAAPELLPTSDEDLPAGSIAGEYKIEKKIGEGGMGSVYGARHPLIGKRAAIKVIRRELSTSREAVDRFVLEAQSVNQIGHPNIVDVFGFGQLPDGRSFFVMEWLEGESLRDRLQRPLQFPEALEILESIAKALQAAHEAGVVHRDLKPDNVYLQARKGEKPSVKLLDFGLAKLTGQGVSSGFNQTRTGMVMGTPLYLSPEQAKGAKIDAATDVYSLGAMAYEMLSGVVPFKADSAVEIMAMHISRPASPVTDLAPWVPQEINRLVLGMLEKEPRNRPTTGQVREQIAATRASVHSAGAMTIGIPAAPSSQPPWTPAPGQRTPQSPQMTPPNMRPSNPAQTPYMQAPQNTPAPYVPTPQATHAPGSAKKSALIIGGLVVVGVGVGIVLFVAFGHKKQPTPHVASVGSATQPDPTPVPQVTPDAAVVVETPPQQGSATETGSAVGSNAGSAAGTPDKPIEKTPDNTHGQHVNIAKPKTGHVAVVIVGPPKGSITIDGAVARDGAGRVSFDLAPGDHKIKVTAAGFKPAEGTVHIDAGGSQTLKLTLEKKRSVNAVEDPFK